MHSFRSKILAFVAALTFTTVAFAATYSYFSPGGALSGTWNSQSVALDSGAFITGDLPYANITQCAARSVLSNATAATSDVACLAAGSDNQVMRRSGTTIAFGQINLASTNAVTGILPAANFQASGSFTLTGTGFATPPTTAATYAVTGNSGQICFDVMSGTSNATSFTMTGVPVAARPVNSQATTLYFATNNGTVTTGNAILSNTGVFIMQYLTGGAISGTWTASGNKALSPGCVTYSML